MWKVWFFHNRKTQSFALFQFCFVLSVKHTWSNWWANMKPIILWTDVLGDGKARILMEIQFLYLFINKIICEIRLSQINRIVSLNCLCVLYGQIWQLTVLLSHTLLLSLSLLPLCSEAIGQIFQVSQGHWFSRWHVDQTETAVEEWVMGINYGNFNTLQWRGRQETKEKVCGKEVLLLHFTKDFVK